MSNPRTRSQMPVDAFAHIDEVRSLKKSYPDSCVIGGGRGHILVMWAGSDTDVYDVRTGNFLYRLTHAPESW